MSDKNKDSGIFHSWTDRQIAAMHRGTAWLRSIQSYDWQIERHETMRKQLIKPMKGIR